MQRQAVRKLLASRPLTPVYAEKLLVKAGKKRDLAFKPTDSSKETLDRSYLKRLSSNILFRALGSFPKRALTKRDGIYGCCGLVNNNTRIAFSTCATKVAEPGGIIEVPLAQTGEGIADCELLSWLVKEGDDIDEFHPLCSVQSDKATIQITSRYKGRVSRLNFVPGDVIKVGESLLELVSGSISVHSPRTEETSSDDKSTLSTPHESVGHVGDSHKRTLATPAVRQLARDYGIKLEGISGSGKDGRVLKEDVVKDVEDKGSLNEEMAMMSNISAPKHVPASSSSETDTNLGTPVDEGLPKASESVGQPEDKDTIIHVRGFQRVMVMSMTAAAKIPHFYLVDELKLDALVKLKKDLQDIFLKEDIKLTFMPFMIKALSVALFKYPLMNSTFNEDASTICCRGVHNVGIAVATSHGLVVPNIKNVQRLSIIEVAKELSRLMQLASSNELSVADISKGTITVSNFGSIGGKVGYPLLNLPEVAIGAFGRMQKVPCCAEDGSVFPASIMNVTWAGDHRVLDGATLTNFCNEWKALVEQPEKILLQLR